MDSLPGLSHVWSLWCWSVTLWTASVCETVSVTHWHSQSVSQHLIPLQTLRHWDTAGCCDPPPIVKANISRKQIILQVVIKILNGSRLCAFWLMNNKVLEDSVCNLLNMKSSLMKYRNWMFLHFKRFAWPARCMLMRTVIKRNQRGARFPCSPQKGVGAHNNEVGNSLKQRLGPTGTRCLHL